MATTTPPDSRLVAELLAVAARLFPSLALTAVALACIKKWVDRHDDLTRERFGVVLGERRGLEELHQRRQRDLDAREAALNRAAEIDHLRQAEVLRQLNETNRQLDAERAARRAVQAELDEVSAERNGLIREVMQERADLFTRRARHCPGPTFAPVSLLRAAPRANIDQSSESAATGDA